MPRFKSNKQYSIKIHHSEFGEFYYSYDNSYCCFVFTKNLNRVKKWKTKSIVEKKIEEIINYINYAKNISKYNPRILLAFGKNIDDEIKNRMLCSNKRYFYTIKAVTSNFTVKNAEENIEKLDKSLNIDIEHISQLIKNKKHIEKDFMDIIKKLTKDIVSYRADYSYLQKIKNESVYIDIINSSFGFRGLKLKNIKAEIEAELDLTIEED